MTDDTSTDTETDPTVPEAEPTAGEPTGNVVTDADGRDVVRYLSWTALGILVLLALIATFQFYTSASRAISVWVTDEYRPLFTAAFNLVVLLAAGAGISLLVRRLA